jgi:glycosyltransferase involved in cell wall biosynthesis
LNKKIIVSVINDVVTDQRVLKECNTLRKMGYEVLLIGRRSKSFFGLDQLNYKIVRLRNPFKKGPLMYLFFNVQLFFYLIFKKPNLLWANDLDTLLPNFIISRLKNIKLVYDSHEYFTLSVYKKTSRRIWERLENLLFPKLKNVITVSDSIKNMYEKKYKVPITVIRNVPDRDHFNATGDKRFLPAGKKILIMQGIGLNENRGCEEAVQAMRFLPADFNLYFIGKGTILAKLKQMVRDLNLSDKVTFIDVLPYSEMMEYTRQCFLGLIFEKIDVTDHHRFALPNKFFDYVAAGIPILSSKATELKLLIEKYQVGDFIDNFEPAGMASKILAIEKNNELYNFWKGNTARASNELNWENEEKILVNFMNHLS